MAVPLGFELLWAPRHPPFMDNAALYTCFPSYLCVKREYQYDATLELSMLETGWESET